MKKKKKGFLWWLLVVIIPGGLLIGLVIYFIIKKRKKLKEKKAASVTPEPIPIINVEPPIPVASYGDHVEIPLATVLIKQANEANNESSTLVTEIDEKTAFIRRGPETMLY